MDKEQAIEIIETHSDDILSSSLLGRALNMAIDALKAQLSNEGTTSDMIDRQKAIDALENSSKPYVWQGAEIVRNLPPVQPEPQEGHWIKHIDPFEGGEQYECSECGVLWEFNDGTPEDNEAFYCPKCGAKMKGVTT